MAKSIMAGRPTPTSPPRTSSQPFRRMDPDDAWDLFNAKLTQLDSLLSCCHGKGNGWFEEAGETQRERMLWLAADLSRDVIELLRASRRQ
ncbi:hypothetical protein INQ48_21865 [Variovorax paradoxus]|nr:hypothetical protein INQ48_21865 [Variovorax paradoxus]